MFNSNKEFINFQDENQNHLCFAGLLIKSKVRQNEIESFQRTKFYEDADENDYKNEFDFSQICSHQPKITQALLEEQIEQVQRQTYEMERLYLTKIKDLKFKIMEQQLTTQKLDKQMMNLKVALLEYKQDIQHTKRVVRGQTEQPKKNYKEKRQKPLWKRRKNKNQNDQQNLKSEKQIACNRLNQMIERMKQKSKSSRSKSPTHLKIFSRKKNKDEERIKYNTYYEQHQNHSQYYQHSQNDYAFPWKNLFPIQNYNPNLLRQVKSDKELLSKPTPPLTPKPINRNEKKIKFGHKLSQYSNFPNQKQLNSKNCMQNILKRKIIQKVRQTDSPPFEINKQYHSKSQQKIVQEAKRKVKQGLEIDTLSRRVIQRNLNSIRAEKSQKNTEVKKCPTMKDLKPKWK